MLGYFSTRFGTPIVVNFLSGRGLDDRHGRWPFQLSGGNDEKYFNAVLNVVLPVHDDVVHRDLPDAHQAALHATRTCTGPYKVPFGMAGVWICGVLTTFWALFASVVACSRASATAAC